MSASHQRGIAVITVLLALALGMLISSEIIMRVYMGMKRSTNQFNALQAWEYALGGEEWARQRLGKDFEEDKNRGKQVDHFGEEWAMPAQSLSIEGGFIEIEVYDAQARFNLNNLVDEAGQINAQQVQVFRRLLQQVGISSVYADMAGKWASYADDAGSEYGSSELPYKAGDTQFGSVSELRLLKGMPLDLYARLRPYVVVLPTPTAININTASEPVLASLSKQATAEKLKPFLEQRRSLKEGFSAPEQYINAMGIQKDEDIDKHSLAVESDFFEIRVRTEYNGRRCYLASLVYRDGKTGEIRLLSRDRSQRFEFETSLRDKKKRKQEEDEDEEDSEDNNDDRADGKNNADTGHESAAARRQDD